MSSKGSLGQVARQRMGEKFLFNFLTGQEIKPSLTVFPNTPTFLKATNVKVIMSAGEE